MIDLLNWTFSVRLETSGNLTRESIPAWEEMQKDQLSTAVTCVVQKPWGPALVTERLGLPEMLKVLATHGVWFKRSSFWAEKSETCTSLTTNVAQDRRLCDLSATDANERTCRDEQAKFSHCLKQALTFWNRRRSCFHRIETNILHPTPKPCRMM